MTRAPFVREPATCSANSRQTDARRKGHRRPSTRSPAVVGPRGGRDREVRDREAVLRVPQLGVGGEVADDGDDRLAGHQRASFSARSSMIRAHFTQTAATCVSSVRRGVAASSASASKTSSRRMSVRVTVPSAIASSVAVFARSARSSAVTPSPRMRSSGDEYGPVPSGGVRGAPLRVLAIALGEHLAGDLGVLRAGHAAVLPCAAAAACLRVRPDGRLDVAVVRRRDAPVEAAGADLPVGVAFLAAKNPGLTLRG